MRRAQMTKNPAEMALLTLEQRQLRKDCASWKSGHGYSGHGSRRSAFPTSGYFPLSRQVCSMRIGLDRLKFAKFLKSANNPRSLVRILCAAQRR